MKHFYILFIFILSCSNEKDCSDLTIVMKSYSGSGYLLNFRTGQDGMGDFWFFPCCKFDKITRNKSYTEALFAVNFCRGISFKLPLTGSYYNKIKGSSTLMLLDSTSFFSKVWITPVTLKIRIEEESTLNEITTMKVSKITLKHDSKIQSLFYYNVNELEIVNLEVNE